MLTLRVAMGTSEWTYKKCTINITYHGLPLPAAWASGIQFYFPVYLFLPLPVLIRSLALCALKGNSFRGVLVYEWRI